MPWTEYRKTAHVEGVLVNDADDVPDRLIFLGVVLTHGDLNVMDVATAEGYVEVTPPFYLCREPGATDHAWPVQPEHFEAWYEEVES